MRNEACFVWIGQALADGSCLRTSSGSGSATDTQLANTITDALFSMPAVGGSAGSVDVDEKATWETCIDCFLKWVEVEGSAMKCAKPISPTTPDGMSCSLADAAARRLAFNKITEIWEDQRSRGERRTDVSI